jgi:hypothetical protein
VGAIGLGLVWGWLLILVAGRCRASAAVICKLGFAITVAGAEVFWMAGRQGCAFFIASTAVALMLHLGWRRELTHRAVARTR